MVNSFLTDFGDERISSLSEEVRMFLDTIAGRTAAAMAAMMIGAALLVSTIPAHADAGFQRWMQQFRAIANQNGITNATFDRAFAGINAPDPEVLRLANNQPEFNAPVWQYFDNQVNEESIANGRAMAQRHARLLDAVEQRFGVDRHIVLAIWSIESRYGEALNNPNARYAARSARSPRSPMAISAVSVSGGSNSWRR
jgi:membrane-bound lytic murein transglycosylase B